MPTLISHLLEHQAQLQQVLKPLRCCPHFADTALLAQKVFVPRAQECWAGTALSLSLSLPWPCRVCHRSQGTQ